MSTVPKVETVFATPALTASSLVTSISTAMIFSGSAEFPGGFLGLFHLDVGDHDAASRLDVAPGDRVADFRLRRR